jgi:ATP-dependent helicase Lhr and Lhr-like helicase
VSRLRTDVAAHLRRDPFAQAALRWQIDERAMIPAAAEQLVDYLAAGHVSTKATPFAIGFETRVPHGNARDIAESR